MEDCGWTWWSRRLMWQRHLKSSSVSCRHLSIRSCYNSTKAFCLRLLYTISSTVITTENWAYVYMHFISCFMLGLIAISCYRVVLAVWERVYTACTLARVTFHAASCVVYCIFFVKTEHFSAHDARPPAWPYTFSVIFSVSDTAACSAVFCFHWNTLTDGQTDRHTDRQTDIAVIMLLIEHRPHSVSYVRGL